MDKLITRRDLLIVPLVVAVPMALLATAASAGGPDPTMTIVKPPEQLTWTRNPDFPEKSVELAPLWSGTSEPGVYYYLVKWHPGRRQEGRQGAGRHRYLRHGTDHLPQHRAQYAGLAQALNDQRSGPKVFCELARG